jgi:uncharacterized heparinase superfamily protein
MLERTKRFVDTALRYWHTLRYLKAQQFYRRFWFNVHRPGIAFCNAVPLRQQLGLWSEPVVQPVSGLGLRRFKFLNQEHVLRDRNGWDDQAVDKLWRYNLHYFNYLCSGDSRLRETSNDALLTEWMTENPPAVGTGWEPYPTSLRIVNWIKWLLAGHQAPAGLEINLATQARWLTRRIEWHLLGNHLFANAKALIFAGLFFDSSESRQWLAKGLAIVKKELPEQVLADGGNFERSTMYHCIFLEDLLDLINIASALPSLVGTTVVATWRQSASHMLAWLEGMTHPDGGIALFNDAAFGIAPDLAALRAYALRVGIQLAQHQPAGPLCLFSWPDSGYVRLSSREAVAILDVAPVGPDYLPGHAHADTLSFELSVHGHRVVVNGGTSCYGTGPERSRERGTAAHSTVEVARQDSSEVWSGFRVARRAYPFELEIHEAPSQLRVSCAHDGYRRLRGKPVHRRIWKMEVGRFCVTDTVSPSVHPAVARYILHPEIQIFTCRSNTWKLSAPNGMSLEVEVLIGEPRIGSARYAPEFGKSLPTKCLSIGLVQGQAQTRWTWS